ncbi:MAG: sarcosine oxidase subunit gamma, partial [Candidatus Promineifilaceae bacterium]
LAAAFGTAPSQNAGVAVVEGVQIGRITPRRYLLITPQGDETAIAAQVEAAVGDAFITVSAQTNGQAMIHVSGAESRVLLSKLCALDFDLSAFPVNTVKISSLAKIRVNIWHVDNGYQLYCGRSYSEYLWETIRQAGAEFGL